MDGIFNIRRDKSRALVIEVGRFSALQGNGGDILHGNTQRFQG